MDLFTYLLAKHGSNSSVHGDLFSYLLGKGQSQTQTISGVTIYIPDAKKLVSFMMTKESTQETTTGKNLLNPNSISVSSGGTISNNIITSTALNCNLNLSTSINVQAGDTIYFSADIKLNEGSSGTFNQINDGQHFATRILNPTISTEYQRYQTSCEYSSDYTLNKMLIQITGLSGTAEIKNIMISKNGDATYEEYTNGASPNPDYPQEVKTVKGSVDVKVVGKNLFPGWEEGSINDNTGEEYDYSNRYRSKGYIKIQQNTNYYFSIVPPSSSRSFWFTIYKYDENKNFLGFQRLLSSNPNAYQNVININDGNTKYIKISEIEQLSYLIDAQLELGTSRTTYEEYKETTTTIPLNGNELAGIGNYKDELLVDKSGNVFINKKIAKETFNGSETWNNSFGTSLFNSSLNYEPITGYGLSNYYKFNPATSQINDNTSHGDFAMQISNTIYRIFFKNTNYTTVNGFKEWLTTHNTEVYYVLKTPELIDLQTTVDLKLFKGVNNISNSVDGYMTIEYR